MTDKKNLTNREKQAQLMQLLGTHMADHIKDKVPSEGHFTAMTFYYVVIGTENQGMLRVEPNYFDGNRLRSLSLGVFRKGTDRLYSNYLMKGTNEELTAYLLDPASHAEWLKLLEHLSESVDDYWD